MNISGLMKTTLLDYPEHVAATIFLGGCNFRCPFCHNMNLVSGLDNIPAISNDELFSFLNKRKGVLNGVCITGGEPTLNKELPEFIRNIKELGYLVKLDTNGTNPDMLRDLVNMKLIDYVAMDIKSSRKNYLPVSGLRESEEIMKKIDESISFLLSDVIDYEFRTTIIKQYHNSEVMNDIGEYIRGAKRYYLQNFTESEYVMDKSLCSCSKDELISFKHIMEKYVDFVALRGVD